MLDDAEMFSQLCEKHGIIAEPEIAEAIKASCVTGELKLSKMSVVANLCEVIAQILSSSSTIKLVDLNDCMLRPKALSCIFKALIQGSSITSLYLKGNNITGSLVEQLGDLLMKNNTLKVLHIEWNILGSQVDVFTKFCNGIANSHYIEELDLRYNQINTLCADSLAAALKTNRSLKVVDLAWNSLGMTGGQKILQAVQQNRTLISLNLKGNCIPNDISLAIEDHIIQNKKRQILSEGNVLMKENIHPHAKSSGEDDTDSRVKYKVQKKKKKKESSRTQELRNSPLGGNSRNDELHNSALELKKNLSNINNENDSNTDLNEKIEDLNKILFERSSNIEYLEAEINLKNNEIKALSIENEKLKITIENLNEENKNVIEEKTKEIEYLKKVHIKEESNWKESYRELEEKHLNDVKSKQESDTKIRMLEKDLRKANLELQSLKEKFSLKEQSYEDAISESKLEVHRIKREMQEKDNRYKIEVNTLKETLKTTTDALEKCQDQLQKLRNELRESLESQTKLKIKTDECERYALSMCKIEDALIKAKEDKEKLEEKLQDSRRTVALLQKQIMKVQEESIEPQKRYDALKIELQLEKENTLNLKSEIKEERTRIKEQNDQLQNMLSQINGLHMQLNEMQTSHAEAIRVKNSEVDKVKLLLTEKARELDDFKSEQIQKAHQFQSAINKYLGSFGIN